MTDIVFEGSAGATDMGAGAVGGRLATAHDGDRVAAGPAADPAGRFERQREESGDGMPCRTVSRPIGNSAGPDRTRGGIAERAIRCGGGRARRGRPGLGLAGLAMFAAAFSALVSLAFPDTARAQAPTPSVCDRSATVQEIILGITGLSGIHHCNEVTAAHLAGITHAIDFTEFGWTNLLEGDFNGLSSVNSLIIKNRPLTELPEGIFDELENLTVLQLSGNRLTGVRADAFSNLGKLQELDLSNNPISRLQNGTFDNLAKVQELRLNDLMLERIPDGLFDGMTGLKDLSLHGNRLGSLQRDVFKYNRFMGVLQLQDNRLTTLPDRIFEHLTKLQGLCLAGNPGAARFRPTAIARNVGVAAGDVARLDASGSGGPWGTNLTYEWTWGDSTITLRELAHFPAVTEFVAPATPGELVFTLTVEGAGNRGLRCNPSGPQGFTDTATVTVTVSAACEDAHHGALRLVGDQNRTNPEREGRLEICIVDDDPATRNGWGVICDDYWTDTAADVACRQLGFPRAIDNRERSTRESLPLPRTYGEVDISSTPFWMDDVICRGDETRFVDCLRRPEILPDWSYNRPGGLFEVESDPFGAHNCRPWEAVGVICLPTTPAEEPETPGDPVTTPGEAPAVTAESVIWDFDGYPDAIDVVLSYDEPVSVTTTLGTPALTLRTGENADDDVPAEYVGGSGSTRLLFRYLLPKPFGSPGPVRVVENSLATRGGTIRYTESGTDVALAHDAATIRPFVTQAVALSWTDADMDDSLGEGDTIEARVTFNEPVNLNTEDEEKTLSMGFFDAEGNAVGDPFANLAASYASGSGTSVLVFSYTMTADDGSPARVEAYTLLASISSVATDEFANLILPSFGELTIDSSSEARVPETQIVSGPSIGDEGPDGVWSPGETVEVTVGFSAAVEVDTGGGTPAIGLRLGGTQARSAAYLRGSGKSELVFGYTLVDADGPHEMMMVPGDSLVLNGGTIRSRGADVSLAHAGSIKLGLPRPAQEESTAQPGGPTARFEGLPQSNDGVTAFSFELHFSEEPDGMSWKTVAGGLLEVSGADVAKARRLDPASNQGWEVDVEPTHDGDIVITLPARACGEADAVCFGNGATPLSEAATTTVPAVPFVGSFSQLPPEHDGETPFELNFHLSVAPARLGFATVRDALFDVAGGRIETAYRLVKGSNLGWTIRVDPTGTGAVTVTLKSTAACNAPPGVCTASGRKLAGGVSAVVPGPASLSVADAEVDENEENASLAFAVTLSRARQGATTVDYATSDGTATAGSDYTATSGTLTFAAGETQKTVSVPVLNDALDEGSETMTLTLSNPAPSAYVHLGDAEATGTIVNSDAMPRAWLSRFGRTVAEQVIEAVGSRLESGRAAGTEVRLAGERIGSSLSAADREALEEREAAARLEAFSEWIRDEHGDEGGHRFRTRAVSERDLVLGSSFTLTGGSEESGYGALWGRAAVSAFDGREGELAVDGEVTSAMVGADFTRGRGTAGVLVSHSEGEGGYRSPDGSGEVFSSLTGLYPYGRWRSSESLSFWGTVGYGAGTLTLEPAGRPSIEADMQLSMAGAGVRNELLTPREGEGASLALTTDGFVVRTTSERVPGELAAARAQVTQVRMGLEGSLEVPLGGGRLVPGLEIGVRHDGGDAETGFGADIGAGLSWSDPASGIEAELRARGLLTHEDASLRERGIAGSFSWDADPSSERGFSLTLRQTVGGPSSGGMHALFGRRTLEGLAANDDGDDLERRRLEATLGYGMGMFGDGFTGTPELGVGLSNADREYRVGWRLGLVRREDVDFDLSLDATRHEPANDDREPSQRIGLRLTARW